MFLIVFNCSSSFLIVSHSFLLFLIDSHHFSSFLIIYHLFSSFLIISHRFSVFFLWTGSRWTRDQCRVAKCTWSSLLSSFSIHFNPFHPCPSPFIHLNSHPHSSTFIHLSIFTHIHQLSFSFIHFRATLAYFRPRSATVSQICQLVKEGHAPIFHVTHVATTSS